MSQYRIEITYKDNAVINVALSPDEIENYFNALTKGEVYWNKSEPSSGFWTNIRDVRYLRINELPEPEKAPVVDEDQDSYQEILNRHYELPLEEFHSKVEQLTQ